MTACERESWSLAWWPRIIGSKPGTEAFCAPLLCGSWRCRRCARWRGAVDWTRCAKAVQSRSWWLYVVLTFDPAIYRNRWEAYRDAGECWDHGLRRSIERAFGRVEYLQTWERHRSGWPHLNVILTGDGIRAAVERYGTTKRRARRSGRVCLFSPGFRQWLLARAIRAGFGRGSLWTEVLDPEVCGDRMAAYLLKLAKELTGAAEKKGDQSPIDAPRHFRRIRASRGLLPKSESSGEWTGKLIPTNFAARRRVEATGELSAPARAPGERAAQPITFRELAQETDAFERYAEESARDWVRDHGGGHLRTR